MKRDQEAIDTLSKILRPGDKVYTILRHVSRSGMSRHIGVIINQDGDMRDITGLVARAVDYRINKDRDALVANGCGMDMGFEVVYNLGRTLFRDGFKVNGRGRNGDMSGWDKDGGYALKHSWL